MYYKEIADKVRYLKTTKEGERDMTDIIELYAENVANKRAKEAAKIAAASAERNKSIEFAQSLLAEHESVERTARLTKLSLEEVRELAAKMSA